MKTTTPKMKSSTPNLKFTDKTPDLSDFNRVASIYYHGEDTGQLLSALDMLHPHLTFDFTWVFRRHGGKATSRAAITSGRKHAARRYRYYDHQVRGRR
jgi:hypothetical protein